MFHPGLRIGVAVSGGADSVCLLHVLRELAPRWNLSLSILHINHRLRGAESAADEAFVAQLAADFQLPFYLESVDVGLVSAGDNLEQAARRVRRRFFLSFVQSGTLDRVALGHTRNDQAETVLFRFLRGSGTSGLAGMRPVTPEGIVRPLLDTTRTEILTWLRGRSFEWREDSSNLDTRFVRNRIRHSLLPQIAQEWNPAIVDTLRQTATWARAEEDYWKPEIERIAAERLILRPGQALVTVDTLRGLPPAVARRLIRYAMEHVKGDLRGIGFNHIELVLEMAAAEQGHGRFQAPGLDIFRSFEWLRFARPGAETLETRNYQFPMTVPGTMRIPGTDIGISLELIENRESSPQSDSVYNGEMGLVDWQRLSGPLELRNWRPGDQYQPIGRAGEEKVKTLFQEARIPLWERRHWPILTDGASIVWTRRFGPAAQFAATPGTGVVLKIQEAGAEPK